MTKLSEALASGEKQCTGCGKVKPLDSYHSSIGTADGRQSRCKECKLAGNLAWRKANKNKVAESKRGYAIRNREAMRKYQKEYRALRGAEAAEYRRRWNLATRYSLTIEDFTRLLESQGGCCAVCGRKGGRQVVDHDHDTGEVRGILCVRCNVAIGSLGDSVEGLMRAVRYLSGESK